MKLGATLYIKNSIEAVELSPETKTKIMQMNVVIINHSCFFFPEKR